MSIPPPSYNNNEFSSRILSYTGSSPTGGGDPFSDYGYGDPSGGGQNSALQQYAQNRQLALSALQNGSLSQQERQTWQKYLQDLDGWFQKYGHSAQGQSDLNQGGNDISANGGLYDGPSSGAPSPDFQDSTKVVYEKGTDFGWNFGDSKNESRTVYLYQQNIDLTLDLASGRIKVSKQFDSFIGKEVTVATWVDRDGREHKAIMPNVKSLKTRTTDPKTQVISDASFSSSGVKLKNLSLDATEEDPIPKGTPPKKVDGDTATWDAVLKEGESVDLTPFSDWKTMNATVKGVVNIIPNGNEEYYTFEYQDGPPSRYVAKAYDDPTDRTEAHLISTINIDANLVKSIACAADKSRVTFLGSLADPKNPHKLNSKDEHAKKISFGDGSGSKVGKAASDKYSSDTPIDEMNGNRAVYNQPDLKKGTLHADFNDDIDEHEMWVTDSADLSGFTSKDTMKVVDYDAATNTLTVEVYKDGIEAPNKEGFKKETIILHGGKNTKFNLHVMTADMVKFKDDSWKTAVNIEAGDGSTNKNMLGEEAASLTADNNGNTTATYDKNADPKFKNNWDFNGDTYIAEVDASGTATINVANQDEKAKVSIDGQWLVIEFKYLDKDGKTKTLRYRYEKDKVDQIKILGLDQSAIDFTDVTDKYAKKIVDSAGKEFLESKIDTAKLDELEGITVDEVKKHLAFTWYDGEGNNGDYSSIPPFIAEAFKAIAKGMKTGEWEDLKTAMQSLEKSINNGDEWVDERRNNAFNGLFMGLYSVLGAKKTKAVFAKLHNDDDEIFNSFKNSFKASSSNDDLNDLQGKVEWKTWEADFEAFGQEDEYDHKDAHYFMSGDWVSSDLADWKASDVMKFIDDALDSQSKQ